MDDYVGMKKQLNLLVTMGITGHRILFFNTTVFATISCKPCLFLVIATMIKPIKIINADTILNIFFMTDFPIVILLPSTTIT